MRGCISGISGEWRALSLSSSLLRCDTQKAKSSTWLLQDSQISGKYPTDFHQHWFKLQRVCFLFGPEKAYLKKLRRMGLQIGVSSCRTPQLQDLQINLPPLSMNSESVDLVKVCIVLLLSHYFSQVLFISKISVSCNNRNALNLPEANLSILNSFHSVCCYGLISCFGSSLKGDKSFPSPVCRICFVASVW